VSDRVHEIEKNLLGAIFLNNKHFDEAAQFLKPQDFCLDSHRIIFRAMMAMRAEGREIDRYTLGLDLEKRGELSGVRGMAYLAALDEGLPRSPAITGYVQVLAEASQARSVRTLIEKAVSEIDTGTNADFVRERCIAELIELQAPDKADSGREMVDLLDRMECERRRKGDLIGLPTGLRTLDAISGGLRPSEVTIVGAWTSVGKSSLMLQAAVANARVGTPTLIFSLEMTRDQLRRRMIAMVSGIPFARVRDAKWASESDMAAIRYAASQIAEWPLEIDQSSGIHVDQLVAKARHAIRRGGVKLVAVDYVQICRADGKDVRMQVSNASRALTRIAKDEGIALIMLAQLARPDRTNGVRRPRLSDLRESSQLENDGNLIVLLHRPPDEQTGLMGSAAELVVAKQRDGVIGTYPVRFSQTSVMFEELQSRRKPEEVAS
jgi:replicative DNA helicase